MTGRILPAEENDQVIEVEIKEVLLGFTMVLTGAWLVGTSVVLIRDHLKTRRQQQLVGGIEHLIVLLTETTTNTQEKAYAETRT